MSCLGIYIEGRAMRALFNYELALKQGRSLIDRNDFGGDPETVRQNVELGLRRTHPFVTVSFWDHNSELETVAPDKVDEGYCLMIKQEAPLYSSLMH